MKVFKTFFIISLILLFSCDNNRFGVPGKPDKNISIYRFDQEFYKTGTSSDSTYLDLYANNIMEVGEPGSKMYLDFSGIFRTDPEVKQLYNDCQESFSDVSDIENQLTWAFFRLQYFLPEITVPKVYMHISGFGESIISANGILSASIDKYLGKDYPIYQSIYQPYQTLRFSREKLVADYMNGWIRSELTEEKMLEQERLLDYMVYEGKLLFLLKVILPDEKLENLIGFSSKQLQWCEANEKNIWDSILKLQHLYSTDRLVIAKYINEAPNTAFFPEDSPGRAAIWIGYQIVQSYMDKNTNITLKELMFKTKSQDILSGSTYHP